MKSDKSNVDFDNVKNAISPFAK